MYWDEREIFYYTTIFHFHIKADTGKIWVYVNNTDLDLEEEFELLRIPISEIVVGFLPPLVREYALA
jgi:XisI protein